MPSKISRKRKAQQEPEEPEIDELVLEEYSKEFKDEGEEMQQVVDDESSDDGVKVTFEGEEQEASSDDEFATNKTEIKLDQKTEKEIKTKVKTAKKEETSGKPGVVFLGRIPHGFYEKQMTSYFRQFGTVNRLRLSRNKKHYAFIEFKHEEVAKIVAETMDGYLIYSHILKCKFIPSESVHPDTFKGANKKFKVIPWNNVERIKHNKPKSKEQVEKLAKKLTLKEKKKRARLNEKLAAVGIEYDFPGYSGAVAAK